MANILLTNFCNLRCDYCFASDNLKKISGKKDYEISLSIYILYLKHIGINGDKEVRLLGGEPLLHSRIKDILMLSHKGGFNILVFSNLSFSNEIIKKIFLSFDKNFFKNLTIDVNLNAYDTYLEGEIDNLKKNISFLRKKGARVYTSNMIFYESDLDFIFDISQSSGISEIRFKPVNGDFIDLDTSSRKYGSFIYDKIVKPYGKEFQIMFSCGLSKNIFTSDEIEIMRETYKIRLEFGCYANGGKYDVDIDGNIFRCFPLQKSYRGLNLKQVYFREKSYIINALNIIKKTKGNELNCLGSPYFKS